MTECGFLCPDNAPTEEAARALPTDVPHMTKEEVKSVLFIVWWHGENAYNTSEGENYLSTSSIMVSEFIEEKDGYLACSNEQYVTNSVQDIEKSALAILEIGEHREGYWNSDRFMEQVVKALKSSIHHLKDTTTSGALTTFVVTLSLLKMRKTALRL